MEKKTRKSLKEITFQQLEGENVMKREYVANNGVGRHTRLLTLTFKLKSQQPDVYFSQIWYQYFCYKQTVILTPKVVFFVT